MQTVYLDKWHDCPLTISDEGHKLLSDLVAQYLVCEACGQPYSEEIPQVAQNLCLSCLIMRQKDLTFVGPNGIDEKGRATFTFLDPDGYVYLSTGGYSEKAEKDVFQTITHWQFSLPTTYTTPHGEMPLHRSEWKLYGDLPSASVIVAEHTSYSSPRFTAVFLAYKEGIYRELTKRDGEMKRLVQKARETVEATRGSDGQYHVGKYPTREVWDSQVYEVISAMESAVYNVQRAIRRKKPAEAQPDEQHEEAAM